MEALKEPGGYEGRVDPARWGASLTALHSVSVARPKLSSSQPGVTRQTQLAWPVLSPLPRGHLETPLDPSHGADGK